MEENKKTSKDILPEEVRQDFRRVQKAEADLYPSSYLLKYGFFPMLNALEAAEMEVEEKDRLSNHWRGMFISAKSLTEDQKTEISSLKREIEEMKSRINID